MDLKRLMTTNTFMVTFIGGDWQPERWFLEVASLLLKNLISCFASRANCTDQINQVNLYSKAVVERR